jgi:hypothetical protein
MKRAKIVRYGIMVDIVTNRAMNDDYKNMSTYSNTYCDISSTCQSKICPLIKIHTVTFRVHVNHNYKKKSLSLIEFFVEIIIFNQVNQARCDQRLRNQK